MQKLSHSKLWAACLMALIIGCAQDPNTKIIYRNSFTVSFYANGGSGEMDDQTFIQDERQALSKNAFTAPKSGQTFSGWAANPNGEVAYADAEFISVAKNLKLYAVWKALEGDGTAQETKIWGIDNRNNFWNYADTSLTPGDDLYKYATGAWRNDPVNVGLWNKAEGREDRTDDQGSPLYNIGLICKEFPQNCSSVIANKSIYIRTKKLLPTETEDIVNELANFLTEKFAEIDALSTQDEVLRYFAKSMVVFHPLYKWIFNPQARKITLSPEINKTYLPLYELLKTTVDADDITFRQLFAAGSQFDSDEVKETNRLKIYWCKYIMGISDTEDTTNDIALKINISKFIYNIAFSTNIVPTNPSAFENAVKAEFSITDDEFLNIPADISSRLSLIGDPTYSESENYSLSVQIAKIFLKYAYTNAGYDIVTGISVEYEYSDYNGRKILTPNKTEIYRTMPYYYANMKIFYEQFIQNNPANTGKKSYLTKMSNDIRDKFIERLRNNTWMSDSTKEAAIKKAQKMISCIGYPDSFDSQLAFDSLPESINNQTVWIKFYEALYNEAFDKYFSFFTDNSKTIEDKLFNVVIFSIDQLQANDFYLPENNIFVILIPNLIDPMCNTDYADAYNYGTIGYVIGHEFCHAFDANGSQYNEYGEKKNWWTLSDKLHYEEKKSQFIEIYNLLQLDSGKNGDGQKTLSENMADFGGLTTVYDLFISSKIKEGFAGEELIKQKKMFFQSYAIIWAADRSDSIYENLLLLDTHSPAPFRVNGVVCQFDDWYDIYNVKRGDKYYLEPQQRIILW
ncbi:MAG: InlB B-repeat-containing protein [Spirochaetales bacterium]|nr:InlB B-repeat-containing protein [Spirochaetales bacterium]